MATRKAQTLIKAARANDPASQLELGRLYLSGGEGMAANPPAAFHWLSKAMASGCKEAAAEIATGIRPDAAFANPTAYARACTIASQSGSASANRILGELLLTGHGVAADFEAALSAFRDAAEAGDSIAAGRLGDLLATLPGRLQEAQHWLERAVAQGNIAAGRTLAELLWRDDKTAAAPWLRASAIAGDVESACRLGELLAINQGGNACEGVAWLKKAAGRGHPRACWRYGQSLAGSPRNLKRALRLLEQAAAAGIAEAWWDLARLYSLRGFSGRDLARSRQCLETAARLNVAAAQLALGKKLAGRRGSLKYQLEAGRWLTRALDAGVNEAAPLLAGLADCARPLPVDEAHQLAAALADIAAERPALAARLLVAAQFDLDAREGLCLDPHAADQDWCLLADVGQHFTYRPWRLVRIETVAQHQAVKRLLQVFSDPEQSSSDLAGSFRARMRVIESLPKRMGLDLGLFFRDRRALSASIGKAA